MAIPFNKPHLTDKEIGYIRHAHELGKLSGDGFYTKKCHAWLEKKFGVKKALLTHSCTAALEMEAILSKVGPGDEVIMPSFTFVSTANAFVLRGATPVFVDIRPDTLNLNEQRIEAAITSKTKAIVPVHYAGVACEMDAILDLATAHKLFVMEDAAQGFLAKYKGKYLGTIGHLGAYSFHETKNIISGEGGALVVNDSQFAERAEIIREKGTNRSKFFRGQVDKYTWVDVGSSYLPGEVIAAFLMAQLEQAVKINAKRMKIWKSYHSAFADLEKQERLRRPIVPKTCQHNAHMYYVLVKNLDQRTRLLEYLKKKDILSVFHYIPLHSAPAGRKYGRASGDLSVTNRVSESLTRLPLYFDITAQEQNNIITAVHDFFQKE